MDKIVFSISGFDIDYLQLLLCLIVILVSIIIYYKLHSYQFLEADEQHLSNLSSSAYKTRLAASLFFLSCILILRIINFDLNIIDLNGFAFTINQVAEILCLFSIALLLDWIISHVIIRNKFNKREIPIRTSYNNEKNNESRATNLVRYTVYLYISQILLKRLDLDVVIMQRMIKGELFTIQISDVIVAVMIILSARILIWFITQISLYRTYRYHKMDEGIQFAINQLVSYVIYVFAIIFALDRIISDMSIIYGGAAALLVGVGLGLQQTFNDFFSGLVLLFERTVMIGDILEIDGQIGRVIKIGLRASRIETRNSVSMLVPNSKLVTQSVINWTHSDNIVRFEVKVSVAYGSDNQLVKTLLLKSLTAVKDVLESPKPFVRLNDFGDNGLAFSVYFFTSKAMTAEDLRSEVRFEISRMLSENNISIPFPQRDVRVIEQKP